MTLALSALVNDSVYPALGRPAVYLPPGGGAGVVCTVLLSALEQIGEIAGLGVRQFTDGAMLTVRVSEIASPAKGGRFDLSDRDELWEIREQPTRRDADRLEWTCLLRPV